MTTPPEPPSPWSRPPDPSQGQSGYPPPPHGQPQYGQAPPPAGQPGYGQAPPAGQPGYGQAPPAGQPSYGQPPSYGQGPAGPYGAPGQPYAPYPATPYGDRPKSRRPLFVIIGGAVAAIVAVLLALGALGIGTGDPRKTADEFMAALRSKDVDKAHSLLCKDGRDKVSTDALRTQFDLDARSITGYTLGTGRTRERDGNDETLVPVTIDYDQGQPVRLEIGVWNDGGRKVCSLSGPGG